MCSATAVRSYAASWRSWAGAVLAATIAMAAPQAHAQLRVDISGVGATQYPIAVADFNGDAQGRHVSEIIRADLSRSRQFRLLNATGANLGVESPVACAGCRTGSPTVSTKRSPACAGCSRPASLMCCRPATRMSYKLQTLMARIHK